MNDDKNTAIVDDGLGNALIIKRTGDNLAVGLKLQSDNNTRNLGTIKMSKRIIYMNRIRAKHLFRKNESYGFNHKLLNDAKLFDSVYLQDEHDDWLIPKEYILEHGSFLHFKSDGFERQIFIPLSKITQFKKQPIF